MTSPNAPSADNAEGQNKKVEFLYMPPIEDIRKLADELGKGLKDVAKQNNIKLAELFSIIDQLRFDLLDRYRHPLTDKIVEIFRDNDHLYNGWSEAMTMVKLDIRNEVVAENKRNSIFNKVLNLFSNADDRPEEPTRKHANS